MTHLPAGPSGRRFFTCLLLASSPAQPGFGAALVAMVLRLLLGLCGLLLTGPALAQCPLSGRVTDGTAPVGWANVVLLGPDGQLVAATVTGEDGGFATTAASGTYTLKVSFLGFIDSEQPVQLPQTASVGTIVLRANAAQLAEVVVTGRRNLVEYQADRVVLHVEKSVAAAGGDAVSAIGAAPGVVVRNNTISLLGKDAVRVMVDGRLLELSGEELVAYLKALPASTIKTVEVLTTPPARYDAAGAGLINITLKQSPPDSWKNTTTLAHEQNTYGAASLHNSLTYQKNRVRLALSASGKRGRTGSRQTLHTAYPSGPWELQYAARQRADNAAGRVALDYDLTPRTAVGGQYAGTYTAPSSHDDTRIDIYAGSPPLVGSRLRNTGTRHASTASHAGNLHLTTTLDTLGRKLSFDGDYFAYRSALTNRFVAEAYSPEQQFLGTNLAARTATGQHIRTFSAKADVEHPLRWLRLSYGAKISLTDNNSRNQYDNTITGTPVPDPSRSDAFQYRETTQALYLSGARSFYAAWSGQLGLRLENTRTAGYSATLNQRNTNGYGQVFPTAYLAYKPAGSHSAQATYSRRVNRPGFGLLNPFRSYANSTSYSEGNPFLQPAFIDNLELAYSYKGALRTSGFVQRTTDGFGPVFTSDPASNTLVISRQNYLKEYSYGLGQSYTASPAAWWQTQSQLYLLGARSRFTKDLRAAPRNTVQLYAATSNTFVLSSSTQLQVDYTYSSPVARGLYSMARMSGLNLGCRQSLLANRLQLTVLLNDVFNTAYLQDYTSTVNGIRQVYSENNGSRFLRVSLTYAVGNQQLKSQSRDFGTDDERKRTN